MADKHDDLAALLGIGMLGAMMDDQSFQKAMQERREKAAEKTQESDKPKPTTEDSAKAAKRIYDAYVQVGFTAEQAFELLKVVLSMKGR